jgi:hypothetical protein
MTDQRNQEQKLAWHEQVSKSTTWMLAEHPTSSRLLNFMQFYNIEIGKTLLLPHFLNSSWTLFNADVVCGITSACHH